MNFPTLPPALATRSSAYEQQPYTPPDIQPGDSIEVATSEGGPWNPAIVVAVHPRLIDGIKLVPGAGFVEPVERARHVEDPDRIRSLSSGRRQDLWRRRPQDVLRDVLIEMMTQGFLDLKARVKRLEVELQLPENAASRDVLIDQK